MAGSHAPDQTYICIVHCRFHLLTLPQNTSNLVSARYFWQANLLENRLDFLLIIAVLSNDHLLLASHWALHMRSTCWQNTRAPVCLLYTVSQKNVPPLACYNFDAREWILIFFGRNVTDKVGNQKTLYYATWNNLCFSTTWQNGETWKSHFSLNWIVLHTQCTCAMSSWKKKLSSVMCVIASNICWDSKISH